MGVMHFFLLYIFSVETWIKATYQSVHYDMDTVIYVGNDIILIGIICKNWTTVELESIKSSIENSICTTHQIVADHYTLQIPFLKVETWR